MGAPGTDAGVHTDVVIVGAGLAGLAAADKLRGTGLRVDVVEASTRIGGRAFGWFWPAAGRMIDLGGTWLLPGFDATRSLVRELGLDLYDSPAADRYLTHFRSGIRAQQYPQDDAALTGSLELLENLSAGEPATAQSVLEQAGLAPDIRDWHAATQRYLAGAPLEDLDAAHLLLDSTELRDPEHYRSQIRGTTAVLAAGLLGRSEARLHLEAPVRDIVRTAAGYTVHAGGEVFQARAVVLAVPLNTLKDITVPGDLLGPLAPFLSGGQPGASRKDWFVLDGITGHCRVFASEGPFGYFRTEAHLPDGGTLAVGLAPAAEGVPDAGELEAGIRTYLPDARVRAHFSYDWSADPWARGTWLAPPVGYTAALAAGLPESTGFALAGGDVSDAFPGTLEGAVVTGRRAADEVRAHLAASPAVVP